MLCNHLSSVDFIVLNLNSNWHIEFIESYSHVQHYAKSTFELFWFDIDEFSAKDCFSLNFIIAKYTKFGEVVVFVLLRIELRWLRGGWRGWRVTSKITGIAVYFQPTMMWKCEFDALEHGVPFKILFVTYPQWISHLLNECDTSKSGTLFALKPTTKK